MTTPADAAVWLAAPPKAWPEAPQCMSFSTLSELEACPRRWALSAAAYPEVWDRPGYPPALSPAALEGTVTHLALEMITRALSDRGCPSVRDPSAIAVLKEFGGFTAVLGQAAQRTLQRYAGNPRAAPVLGRARRHLTARAADLRARVQGALSRVRLEPRPGPAAVRDDSDTKPGQRAKLPNGSHSEVRLEAEELGWRGVADLLTLSSTACEIRDFKTGAPKEDHEFQLKLYALLWRLDGARNPDGRVADRLVISYDSGDVDVPAPTVSQLEALKAQLSERSDAAVRSLDVDPPEARPSATTCAYCSVRHLCDAYWREPLPREAQGTWFADLQLKLTARHGTTSWDGVVECCSGLVRGSQILLRTVDLSVELRSGMRVRVLNVRVSAPVVDPAEREPAASVASMGATSELFLIPG